MLEIITNINNALMIFINTAVRRPTNTQIIKATNATGRAKISIFSPTNQDKIKEMSKITNISAMFLPVDSIRLSSNRKYRYIITISNNTQNNAYR